MSKYYETEEFKDLKQKWYKKLREDNFKDIESFVNKQGEIFSTPYINSDIKNLYKMRYEMNDDTFQEYYHLTYLYYSACRAFLAYNSTSTPILSVLDTKILEFHSNGLSLRKICRELRKILCRYPPYKRNGTLRYFYSYQYINTRLKHIKEQVRLWNLTHPDGIRYEDYND